MPPWNFCRAGGWHLRMKPRVGIASSFFRFAFLQLAPVILLFACLGVSFVFASRCGSQLNSDDSQDFLNVSSSMELDTPSCFVVCRHWWVGKMACPTGYEPKMIQSDDLEPRRIELDRNLWTDPYQNRKEFWKMTIKILLQKIRRKLEKLLSTNPTFSEGYTPIMIQLKAVLTRIFEMEIYKKCWFHRCMHMGEEKMMVLLKKPQVSGKPEAEVIQKRGASAPRTQADHSRRGSLKPDSSQEPRASGKLDAVFSPRSD